MNSFLLPLFALILFLANGAVVQSPEVEANRDAWVRNISQRVEHLERADKGFRSNFANNGGVAFLFGAFCALWAQNTRRNAWLWFFLGLFFSVIAVIVVLTKTADDRFTRQQKERYTGKPA